MTPKTKYVLKGAVIGTVAGVWFLSFLAPVVGALVALWMWKKKSSPEAAIELGRRYYDGNGVTRDLRKAFECWSGNAEALDAETALKLADMYRDGEVTDKDLKKAFPLYKKAPRQEAEQRIMEIFERGVNLSEYTRFAAESYARRFENGDNDLLDKIIELYTSLNDGENLKKYQIIAAQKGDPVLAAKWGKELFKTDKAAAYPLLCAADGERDPEIFFLRARILETGDGAVTDLPAAKEYYRKAADAGYGPAARNLAGLLRKSTEKSEQTQAFALYRAAAERGDAEAKYELAGMLAQGIGTEPDAARAMVMWRELAATGYSAALPDIAEAYRTGTGCDRDLTRAVEFAEKAVAAEVKGAKKLLDALKADREEEIKAEKQAALDAAIAACDNDATGEAELNVARLYEAGETDEESPEKIEYYRKAAAKGNAEALYRLGKIEEDDQSDIARALELYESAAKRGSGEAKKALAEVRNKIEQLERDIKEYVASYTEGEGDPDELFAHIPLKYAEYEIPYSFLCGLQYFKNLIYLDEKACRDSDDVKDLAIGFIKADLDHDNENCWHYAAKLLSLGVYWPLLGFFDKFSDDLEKSLPFICAMKMHGCLEAAGILAHLRTEAESDTEWNDMWNNAVEQAKGINAEWLEKRSHEMKFPSMSGDDESDDSEEETTTSSGASGFPKFYSLNELDEAFKSDNPEVKNWAACRSLLVEQSIGVMWTHDGDQKSIACLKAWLDLTGKVLTERYAPDGGFCPGVHQDPIGFFYMFTYQRLQNFECDYNLIPLNERFRRDLQCQHAFREQCEILINKKNTMWLLGFHLLGNEKILSDEKLTPLRKIMNIPFDEG